MQRLDKFEEQLRELREIASTRVTSVEAAALATEKRSETWFGRTWPDFLLKHEALSLRIAALETARSRAEGAVWAARFLYLAIVAGASALGWNLGHNGVHP